MTERLTLSQLRQLQGVGKPTPKKKRPKYNNTEAFADGFKFDSAKEKKRYQVLKVLEQKGVIQDLQMQVPFVLAGSVKFKHEAKAKRAMKYYADFVYFKDGKMVVEDVKSPPTRKKAEYRQKKHFMMWVHGIEIIEV